MILWKKILCVLLAAMAAVLSVWLFPRVAAEPVTFIDLQMDPAATQQKYADVWDDTTIRQIADPHLEYASGDTIGTITIPQLNIYELPIYYDANYINSNWQITAPGHFGNWGIPGEASPACIGSHNYQLFHQLPTLKPGDKFIIENDYDTYVYIVTGSEVYDHTKDDWNSVAFNSKAPYTVELMTCYPIDAVVTDDTYIVSAQMVKGTQFIAE